MRNLTPGLSCNRQKKAPPERGQLVACLPAKGGHLLRQPSFVVSVGALNLRALRSGALVSRARNGELLDGAPKADLNTGRLTPARKAAPGNLLRRPGRAQDVGDLLQATSDG